MKENLSAIIAILKVEIPVSIGVLSVLTFLCLLLLSATITVSLNSRAPEPVEPYKLYDAPLTSQRAYVELLSERLALSYPHDPELLPLYLSEVDVYSVACGMIEPEMDIGRLQRLLTLVSKVNPNGCPE